MTVRGKSGGPSCELAADRVQQRHGRVEGAVGPAAIQGRFAVVHLFGVDDEHRARRSHDGAVAEADALGSAGDQRNNVGWMRVPLIAVSRKPRLHQAEVVEAGVTPECSAVLHGPTLRRLVNPVQDAREPFPY